MADTRSEGDLKNKVRDKVLEIRNDDMLDMMMSFHASSILIEVDDIPDALELLYDEDRITRDLTAQLLTKEDQDFQKALADSNIFQVIRSLLEGDDEDLTISALSTLSKLWRYGDGIIANNLIELITQLLEKGSGRVKDAAVNTLRSLITPEGFPTEGSINNMREMFKIFIGSNGLNRVVDLIHDKEVTNIKDVMLMIGMLSGPEHAQEIIELDILDRIFSFLGDQNGAVDLMASTILANLGCREDVKDEIVTRLKEKLNSEDEIVRGASRTALTSLYSLTEDENLIDTGLVDEVLTMMEGDKESDNLIMLFCQLNETGLLEAFLERGPLPRLKEMLDMDDRGHEAWTILGLLEQKCSEEVLEGTGILEKAVSILNDERDHIKYGATDLFRYISNSDHAELLIKYKTVGPLIGLLSRGENTTVVVMIFEGLAERGFTQDLMDEGLLEAVGQLLESEHSSLHGSAYKAINIFIDNGMAEKIIKAGYANTLVRDLDNEDTIFDCLYALRDMAEGGLSGSLIENGVIPRLKELAQIEEYRELASEILVLINRENR